MEVLLAQLLDASLDSSSKDFESVIVSGMKLVILSLDSLKLN